MTHLLFLLTLSVLVVPDTPGSFTTAKTRASEVTQPNRQTLYCDCSFNEDNSVNVDTCSYEPQNLFTGSGDLSERWQRIEWEHVVSAYRMGSERACWTDTRSHPECQRSSGSWMSSRECCRKVDPEFRAMETDVHNLWPVVGELNGDRSNKEFGTVAGEEREYGLCDFEVGSDLVEVRDEAWGEVARAYLYMSQTWGLPLSDEERVQYRAWNEADPPTAWELARDKRIFAVQGNHNTFVTEHSHVHDGKMCTPVEECCRVCRSSQACGDSCISKEKTCSKSRGCSCNEVDLCP